jgi:hypothetical protein
MEYTSQNFVLRLLDPYGSSQRPLNSRREDATTRGETEYAECGLIAISQDHRLSPRRAMKRRLWEQRKYQQAKRGLGPSLGVTRLITPRSRRAQA